MMVSKVLLGEKRVRNRTCLCPTQQLCRNHLGDRGGRADLADERRLAVRDSRRGMRGLMPVIVEPGERERDACGIF